MTGILFYFFEMTLASGILLGYYWIFLRNRRFHWFNRVFLLMSLVFSLILPFLSIPLPFAGNTETGGIAFKTLHTISIDQWENESSALPITPNYKNSSLVLYSLVLVYLSGALLFLYAFLQSLLYILNMRRKYAFNALHGIRLYTTEEPGTPFSFFRSLFWHRSIPLTGDKGRHILRHELFHIRQYHSLDIFCTGLINILFWFNPFFFLIKKELKAIHEFLADAYAASGNDRFAYAELLVLHSMESKHSSLSHPFFQTHIKRRITMITHHKKAGYVSRIMALPVAAIVFCLISFKANHSSITSDPVKQVAGAHAAPYRVFIDAGHGGTDKGAHSTDGSLFEKDLALAISKKIASLAKEYDIEVSMSRETDILPPLKERPKMAMAFNADVFLSIHVNNYDKNTSVSPQEGFEIVITNRNQKIMEGSRLLGSAIVASLKGLYVTKDKLLQPERGVWVVDHSPCPAALIECGYINNDKDLAFVNDPANQEKIARKILEGVRAYKNKNQ